MKNKGYKPEREWYGIGTIIAIVAMASVLVAIVLINVFLLDGSNWSTVSIGLMNELLYALIVSLFLYILTTIFTKKIISVQRNMGRLRKMGIVSIGTTKSTAKDINLMFGGKKHPDEVKLLFLTGALFFKDFKHHIIRAMNNGTKFKIMIASGGDKNKAYLNRIRVRYLPDKEEDFYTNEINNDVENRLNEIRRYSIHPENMEVRHYLDEYQNNLRIATYNYNNGKRISYYWINLQPPNSPAVRSSITHRGKVDWTSDKLDMDDNLCCQFEMAFDELWDKYPPKSEG